ncbi:iron ABC transporter permease [Amycolatopsis acidicola]|uniref:Iron ABC transporter permease n=1 Tax=Amycolatopsis acidicola TaxID=2596893 RepID=A0A5N0V0U3_9PSEU|nr:iron ABC transporter permease [Amycolatopsis acidicola]KAA9160087.1 iron ABC transporter permease [Amycolatopsis acidicola]
MVHATTTMLRAPGEPPAVPPHRRRFRAQYTPERLVLTVFVLAVAALIAAPIVQVILRSFQRQTGLLKWVWSDTHYTELLSSDVLTSARNSCVIALGAMAVATVVGVALGWLVARTDLPFRRAFEVLNLVPFFLSPLIGSIAWTYLGDAHAGLLNQLARSAGLTTGTFFDVHSTAGIIVVLGLFLTPFVMLQCGAAFRQMDSSLEQAAQACGASPFRTAVRITLPLAGPAILSAAILVFVLGIEDLSVPLVLGYGPGIQTLSTRIYDAVQIFPPDYNFGAALGCVLMLITAGCLYLQRRALRDRGFVTVSGRGASAEAIRLGRWRWLALAGELAYLGLAAVLPVGVLAIVAFSAGWTGSIDLGSLTFDNVKALSGQGSVVGRALVNSLVLSTACAFLVVAISVVVVYALERTRITGRRLFEVCLTMPVAVPGLVLGVGLLTLVLRTPLFGSLWIIGIAYTVRFLPFAQRSVSAAFLAVHPELEEAARLSGAGWFRYTRRVLLPLVRPGLAAGWMLVFLTFMRELPMSALLQTSGTQTLSVGLLNSVSFEPPGVTAAFTLLQTVVLLGCSAVFWIVTTRRGDTGNRMAVAM